MAQFDSIASELFTQSLQFRGRLSAPYLPLPSGQAVNELIEAIRKTLFPGFYGETSAHPDALRYKVDLGVRDLTKRLQEMLKLAICYRCAPVNPKDCDKCTDEVPEKVRQFITSLPALRRALEMDLKATYEGDPACRNMVEVICCYPGFRAVTNYRIAHALHMMDIPYLPRMITEIAHTQTGIDIHPAASIGEGLMIDHGTGIVIGESCQIGVNVRIYQGVTLGALTTDPGFDAEIARGIPRHPVIGDEVVIYPGAAVLGRVTIGKGAVLGGNVCVMQDVAPGARIMSSGPGIHQDTDARETR
ncbi:MAG TPA: serine acetyltransferase [Bacteroidales bacterium]|nr:serine acetyltransferase [Bacteroidales bacterium]